MEDEHFLDAFFIYLFLFLCCFFFFYQYGHANGPLHVNTSVDVYNLERYVRYCGVRVWLGCGEGVVRVWLECGYGVVRVRMEGLLAWW